MVPNSMMFRVGSALTAAGIVLALTNWYVRPAAWLAWAAVLAMFGVMLAMLRLSSRAVRRFATEASSRRGLDQIATAVVFAALMMGIPLALTLARSYGLVDGDDVARRSTGALIGAFLMVIGNVLPKNLPPFSSGYDAARQQEFQRLTGWTWVLCGLASSLCWFVLPIDVAQIASVALVLTAVAGTIVHLVRLARRAKANPPIS